MQMSTRLSRSDNTLPQQRVSLLANESPLLSIILNRTLPDQLARFHLHPHGIIGYMPYIILAGRETML